MAETEVPVRDELLTDAEWDEVSDPVKREIRQEMLG